MDKIVKERVSNLLGEASRLLSSSSSSSAAVQQITEVVYKKHFSEQGAWWNRAPPKEFSNVSIDKKG